MGKALLKEVLSSWDQYELDDQIYVPSGVPLTLDTEVAVFVDKNYARGHLVCDLEYFLGFEQVRDQIEGLEHYFGRSTTPEERLIAVLHYAEFDAPLDPEEVAARSRRAGA